MTSTEKAVIVLKDGFFYFKGNLTSLEFMSLLFWMDWQLKTANEELITLDENA